MSRPSVYVLLAADGRALYVGYSQNVEHRLRQHRSTQPWADEIADVRCFEFDTFVEAEQSERQFIAELDPVHNQQRYGGHAKPSRKTLYLELRRRLQEFYEVARSCSSYEPAGQQLNDYCHALHSAGWPYQAIAQPLGLSREAIRQRCNKGRPNEGLPDVIGPYVPRKPAKPGPRRLDEWTAQRLRDVYALASQCRGPTSENDPRRQASIEVTRLLAELVADGYGIQHLADTLGVTYRGVRFRLGRHGYLSQSPSQRATFGTKPQRLLRNQCKWGHDLSGDNVRIWRGTRVCKACDYRRTTEYRARLRAQREGALFPAPTERQTA